MSVSTLHQIDEHEVQSLPYVGFMAALEELNRPPGGVRSVFDLARGCLLGPGKSVLDVGCNTGYVALELTYHCGCRGVGIDLSESMIEVAKRNAHVLGVADRVRFEVGDARQLSFADETFDAA